MTAVIDSPDAMPAPTLPSRAIGLPPPAASTTVLPARRAATAAVVAPVAPDPPTERWPWIFAAIMWVQYTLVGAWLLDIRQFAISDSVSRTLSAKLMVLGRDPHLASVGFYWMPIPTITRIPFVLVLEPFGQSILAGPMTSGLFAAATIPILVTIVRTLDVPRGVAIAVAVCWAFNPITVWIGANGMSESTFGFFIASVMLGVFRFRRDGSGRSLALLGLAAGGAMACRYEMLLIVPVIAVAVALAAPGGCRRGAVFVALVPAVVVVALWALASKLIMGQWFFWYWASRATTATPPGAQWLPSQLNLATSIRHVGLLAAVYSPAIVAVAVSACASYRRWRSSLFVLGLFWVLPVVVAVQLASGSSWMVPRVLVHLPLVGTVGALWALDRRDSTRVAHAVGWIACLLVPVGAVSATWFLADRDNSHPEGEFVLLDPLLGRVESGAGVDLAGDGSNRVFFSDLRPFRELNDDLDPLLAGGASVAMDSLQGLPILLSDHADRFIVPEDREFEQIMADPEGRFQYIILIPSRQGNGYSVMIEAELGREAADGGTWHEIGNYDGTAILYEFRPSR